MLFDDGFDFQVDDAIELGSFPLFNINLFFSNFLQERRTSIQHLFLLKQTQLLFGFIEFCAHMKVESHLFEMWHQMYTEVHHNIPDVL